ncbi:MAG TPA: alpha/beta fold hydrolase [Anaerolineae bacterium]
MAEFSWWTGGQIGYLDTPDGRVAYRYWEEARDAAKTLLGIHGIGGNNDNYIALGEALKPDVAVYAIDLAGHGESGTPGDVAGLEVHLRNLDALSALIRARHPNAKHYLAGYSLGAAYASVYVARNGHRFDGVILFAAPFRTTLMPSPHMHIIFRALTILAPRKRIRIGGRSEDRLDPRYRFAMHTEKFIGARTLRSLKVALDMVTLGERALPGVTIPTLIIHSDADSAAPPDGARLAYERLGSRDKALHWVPGAQHDLYDMVSGVKSSEVSGEQRSLVIQPVREWLEMH